MGRSNTLRAVAATGAVLFAVAGCGSGSDSGTPGASGTTTEAKKVNVYGTDGNMGNALGQQFTEQGALTGMQGTTPLTELGDDFKTRLLTIDPSLVDFNYSGESYDAVVLTALAAETARSNAATVFAPYVNGLTATGTACTTFADCLAIVQAGGDVDYDGITGPLSFTDAGEPAVASFAILQFGADNTLDDSLTQYVIAGDESKASTATPPTAPDPTSAPTTGPLTVGTLLPSTGNLAFLGPPEIAGVKLAIADINAAGGVLGADVALIEGDSGDATTDTATQTVDRLINSGANAIIGAASSGVSLTVIDRIVGAGILEFSPANTSDKFTTYDDKGLYFRTAPPDIVQARALTDQLIADGNNSVGLIATNDPYGTGLASNIQADLVADGLSMDATKITIYDPKATSYRTEVDGMKEFNPDAIVVIGFDESAKIITTMNEQGIGPAS